MGFEKSWKGFAPLRGSLGECLWAPAFRNLAGAMQMNHQPALHKAAAWLDCCML